MKLLPQRAGSELLELRIGGDGNDRFANVVFAPIQDRRGRNILSVRDQNTFEESLRKKRLMTLVHLWLVHRYKSDSVHYVTPTEDNQYQTAKMKSHGLFSEVQTEVGQIIVADVNHAADRGAARARPGGVVEAHSQRGLGIRGPRRRQETRIDDSGA